MENSERDFEQQWQQVFRDAESAPPEKVWLSVENFLKTAEANSNRRRLVIYRRLAATFLLICIASISVTYWMWRSTEEGTQQSASSSSTPASKEITGRRAETTSQKDENSSDVVSGEDQLNGLHGIPKEASAKSQFLVQGIVADSFIRQNPKLPEGLRISTNVDDQVDTLHPEAQISLAVAKERPKDLTPEEEKALVKKLLGEGDDKPEPSITGHPAWASVSFSGGSYSPYVSSSPLAMADIAYKSIAASDQIQSPAPVHRSSGVSYSFGFLFGKQLGKRVMVQTGFVYMTQQIDYESNVVNGQSAFAADYSKASGVALVSVTNPYTLHSNSEFISLPIQAGYVFLDRKFGLMVHTGVATDFFLRNTLTDPAGKYTSSSQSGDDGVFKAVSWAGLINAELSYKLADRYRLSLVPGIRYSFTSTLKEDTGNSQPLVSDIGLRFRYIFP